MGWTKNALDICSVV